MPIKIHANDGSEQLQREINAVINRYAREADLTVAVTLGVLELVKAELLEQLTRHDKEQKEDNEDES